MAVKRNSLTDVGPVSGQFKSEFSISEASQINALRGMSGSVSPFAGRIGGDVSNSLSGLNNTTQGKLNVGILLADSMAGAGITDRNITNILSSKVSSSIVNRKSIDKTSTETPIDLSNPGNRLPGSKNRSPKEKIEREKRVLTGRPNTEFPNDLTKHASAWVLLSFERYSRENAFTPGNVSPAGNILLPLPENYNQTFSLNYSQQNQGVLGDLLGSPKENTALREEIMKMKNEGVTMSGLSAAFGNLGGRTGAVGMRSLFGTASALGSMADIIPGIDAGSSAADVLGSVIGAIPNPHSSIFFKGVSLREFTWTWRLVPRSSDEAATIREIIAKLREHILPRKGAFNSLEYPDLMQPVIFPEKSALGQFKKCMVSNMTINYSAEGASAFFRDGHPVAIQLGLNFQEVEIQTAEEQGQIVQSGIDATRTRLAAFGENFVDELTESPIRTALDPGGAVVRANRRGGGG